MQRCKICGFESETKIGMAHHLVKIHLLKGKGVVQKNSTHLNKTGQGEKLEYMRQVRNFCLRGTVGLLNIKEISLAELMGEIVKEIDIKIANTAKKVKGPEDILNHD